MLNFKNLQDSQVFEKRSKKIIIAYYISLLVFGFGVGLCGYAIISGVHTKSDMKRFIIGLIINVYSFIFVVMFEERPKYTRLQIKQDRNIMRTAGLLIILWTLASSALTIIFLIPK